MYERYDGNVSPFASNSQGTERTVFGDTVESDDINDNLNADFLRGWGIVGLNDNPTKQDFNALGYTLGNLTSYLYQMGIAEWNDKQEYITNSYVIGNNGKIYRAKTGTDLVPNVGNNPLTDTTNWDNILSSITNTSNKSLNGWFKDESTGLIFQWGNTTELSNIISTTLFPISFPNQCFIVNISDTGITPQIVSVNSKTNTSFTALTDLGTTIASFFAIGY